MAQGDDPIALHRQSAVRRKYSTQDITSLYLSSDEIQSVVCRDHAQEFKHFYEVHKTSLCITCRRIGHTSCKAVIGIKEASEYIYSEAHGEKIIKSLTEHVKHFRDYMAALEDTTNNISKKSKLVIGQIEQTRKEVNNYLDEVKDTIDRNSRKKVTAVDELIQVCGVFLSCLSTSVVDIDRAMSKGDREEMFIKINATTKQIKLYSNTLLQMNRKMVEMDLKIEPGVELSDICQKFGMLSLQIPSIADTYTVTKPVYTAEMKLVHKGKAIPFLTPLYVLQDGRKLVLIIDNAMIQLYDANNDFLTEIAIPVPENERCLTLLPNSRTDVLWKTFQSRHW